MPTQPSFALEWLRQRQSGAAAVAAIEAEELHALTPAEGLAQAEALLDATPLEAIDPSRREWSGFVEQQRLFARARR